VVGPRWVLTDLATARIDVTRSSAG